MNTNARQRTGQSEATVQGPKKVLWVLDSLAAISYTQSNFSQIAYDMLLWEHSKQYVF